MKKDRLCELSGQLKIMTSGLGEYIAIYSHIFRILAVAKLVPRMHTSCPTRRAKVFLQLEHVFSSKKDICLNSSLRYSDEPSPVRQGSLLRRIRRLINGRNHRP